MPITFNNKPITDADLKALKDMLKGTMESVSKINKESASYRYVDSPRAAYKLMDRKFQEAADNVDEWLNKRMKKSGNTDIADIVEEYMDHVVDSMADDLQDLNIKQRQKASLESAVKDFGNKKFIDMVGGEQADRDKDESYDISESGFELPTEPIPGIENLEEYDPATDSIRSLYGGRYGNSGTLKLASRIIGDASQNPDNAQNPQLQQELDMALQKSASFHICAEHARMHSVGLKSKDEISFADLYNAFTDLNKSARIDELENAGKIRGCGISAGKIHGPGPAVAPKALAKTLSKIAQCMNQIKKTENEALRKSQAIQLAAYAYQMTLSEHVFDDANGRTCRMFADTILQTFGLPPHTPSEEELSITKTLGDGPMDFKKGSRVFFDCIKKSSDILKEERDEFKKTPEYKMQLEGRIKDLKTVIKNLSEQADKKLKALETMTKAGHRNGDEYNNMHNALKNLAQMDKDSMTLERLDNMLDTLDQASQIYQRTHTGWFVATKGYGEDRFNMSIDLQEFSKQKTDMLASFSKGFDKGKKMSDFTAEDLMDVNQPIQAQGGPAQAAQGRKRSNSISFKELKRQEDAANPQKHNNHENVQKRRNSISASPKKNDNIKKGP